MQKQYNFLTKLIKLPARTDVFCIACLWLIIVVSLGTIAQKEIGLYMANKKYFSSIFWWLFGIFPVPSAGLTIAFIFWGLLIKTLSEKWHKYNIGTLIVHIGVLLLILGGFITAKYSREGNMVLAEGGKSNYVASYHDIELAISDVTDGIEKDVAVFPDNLLKKGNILKPKNLLIEIEVEKFCRNCAVSLKEDKSLPMPERIVLQDAKLEKIEEENVSGIRYTLKNAGEGQDKSYIAFENIPVKSRVKIADKIYKISLRHSREYLPFSVKLLDFEKKTHAATNMAKSYKSEILLKDGDYEWRSIIQMNEPLRYKGYTFYQSSVLITDGKELSVLAVVRNVGRLFPYISSIIICIGLLIHLFIRLPNLMRSKNLSIFIILLASFTPTNLLAVDSYQFEYSNFEKIPILHEGRIKPLDSVARIWLKTLYGKEKLPNIHATEWLAELILTPEKAKKRQIFNISNPDVVEAIDIEWKSKHLYSFDELFPAIAAEMPNIVKLYQQEQKDLSLAQRQLLELVAKMGLYVDLARSFNFDPKEMTSRDKTERKILTLDNIFKTGRSVMFRVIPPQWTDDENWYSPWEILYAGKSSPKSVAFVKKWHKAKEAYSKQDIDDFQKISQDLLIQSTNMSVAIALPKVISFEVFYNKAAFLKYSLYLYILSFIAILFYSMSKRKFLYALSVSTATLAVILHIIAIASRMYIMARPPVSTLYESIIFVAMIAVIFALYLEGKNKNVIGVLMASIIGSILQFIGMKYASDGDTMGMLVAVLDTNFWLATHVVTITIGYGFCVLGSVLAHFYLLQKIFKSNNRDISNQLFRNMVAITLLALLFSILGTILGGIWADQSWGRFWGWDPKENGALVICLWLILLLHGIIAKLLSTTYFAVGMVLTNIVLALAWFGVNLLNVGLHSYGFTGNIANNLVIFTMVELLFLTTVMAILSKKRSK